ncbi:hypothetical protein ACOSP7_007018 [Xanthoceras sorbifolium]
MQPRNTLKLLLLVFVFESRKSSIENALPSDLNSLLLPSPTAPPSKMKSPLPPHLPNPQSASSTNILPDNHLASTISDSNVKLIL